MIKICGFCRRVRPMHLNNCIYTGAVQYADVMNVELPPEPYIDCPWPDDQLPRHVSLDDVTLVRCLREMLPQQLELRRVIES